MLFETRSYAIMLSEGLFSRVGTSSSEFTKHHETTSLKIGRPCCTFSSNQTFQPVAGCVKTWQRSVLAIEWAEMQVIYIYIL